jgi:CDP-diacylglycerol---serine O-phosphatidyltransferase
MSAAWVPNTLTLGNLACGFVSIVFASRNSGEGYIIAAVLILFAALLDGLDGQAARWLKVSNPVGKELDSLADCVTFGVAPGFLAYKTYLVGISVPLAGHPLDLGVLIAVIFPICAAYRLGRFNAESFSGSFSGLPSPIAAILVALAPLCFRTVVIPWPFFAAGFLAVAFLMVSTVRYTKPQSFIFKNLHGFKLAGLIILVALLLFRFQFRFIFLFIVLYVLSGLIGFLIKFIEEHRY